LDIDECDFEKCFVRLKLHKDISPSIVHKKVECFTQNTDSIAISICSVVGCLIDVEQRLFKFYLDGIELQIANQRCDLSSDEPYYATVVLIKLKMPTVISTLASIPLSTLLKMHFDIFITTQIAIGEDINCFTLLLMNLNLQNIITFTSL